MTPATKAMTATAKEEARTEAAPAICAGGVYEGIGTAAAVVSAGGGGAYTGVLTAGGGA
jgi:hypothetical protein